MIDNQVLQAGKQSQTEDPTAAAFKAAVALLQKGDIISLEFKTSTVTVNRGLNTVPVSSSDLGFAESYRGQEAENRFVTHCENIAKSKGLTVRPESNDGHYRTLELV